MSSPDGRLVLGRRADLETLRRALAERDVVSITGAPGIGKSALVMAVSSAALVRVGTTKLVPLRVALAGVETGGELARRIGEASGDAPSGSSAASIASRLASQRRLVVFDDADGCLDALAGVISAWRPWSTGSACLVTAAGALPHSRATSVRLGPLATPVGEADASAVASVELLLDELRRRDAKRSFTPADLAAASSIARLVEGVPLSLKLAAASAFELGLPWVEERLARGDVSHLRVTELDVEPRHRTLAAATARSWASLDPESGQLASTLAMFPGDFDLAAACAVSGLDADRAAELVTRLVRLSILEVTPSDSGVRYRMLHILRVEARARLEPHAQEAARAAQVRYWAGARAHVGWVIIRSDEGSRAERPARTQAFVDAAELQMIDEARSIFVSLAPGYLAEGPLDRFLELVGLARGLPQDRVSSGTIAFFEAMTLLFLGRPKEALTAFVVAERDAPPPLAALAMSYRGVILGLGGDFARGEAACLRAEARLGTVAAPELLGRALKNTANVLAEKGSGLALDYLVRAEACFRSVGDAREEAFVRMLRLSQLVDEGDLAGASRMEPSVMARLEAVQDRRTIAWARGVLGILEQERGAFGRAREHLARAEDDARSVGDAHTSGILHYYAARLDLEQGDLGSVADRCAEARALLEPARDFGHLALAEGTLAWAHHLAGRDDAARAAAARASAFLPARGREARRAAVRAMVALARGRKAARRDLTIAGEEVRFVARLLSRTGRTTSSDRLLRVGADSSWIADTEARPINLGDSPMLRALVDTLVRARERKPGASVSAVELAARLWPKLRFDDETGNRLYVALARLRKMGLGNVLERTASGYRFAPDVPIRRVEGSANEHPR